MIPRKRLDISWSDLLFGLQACVWSRGEAERESLEASWSLGFESIACLSVRSGFDALLSALSWPPGSEVLVSAVTIRDMARLLTEHGLVPVPIDVDFTTLDVSQTELRRAITAKTKGIVVAHLFGSRLDLSPVCNIARERGLFIIEDCAQAFAGGGWRGHEDADVSMFSFGPIKTATALGGGVLRFRDPQLADRIRRQVEAWPRQSNHEFLRRLLKYSFLMVLSNRATYTIFTSLFRWFRYDHDSMISHAVRGFAGGSFLTRIRRRRCRDRTTRRSGTYAPRMGESPRFETRPACMGATFRNGHRFLPRSGSTLQSPGLDASASYPG